MNDRSLRASVALAALVAAAAPDVVSYGALKEKLRGGVDDDPIDAALSTVLVASYLFYAAEKGQNPKVITFADAFVFISTNLSVGYSDILARTEAGKAIATAVMTFGPGLAASIFDPPRSRASAERDGAAMLEAQRAVVSKLEAILGELKARP